jgi:Mrp family chromosome partitioning ATPase
MFKQAHVREEPESSSGSSFVEMYLQEVQAPLEHPEQPEPLREDVPEAVRQSHEVSEEDSPDQTPSSSCPEHLRLHPDISELKPWDAVRLSAVGERRLMNNTSELSLVEGNILSNQRRIRSIYIASCFNGEGKTVSAVSTAYALSSLSGKRVLLVDGNNSSPRLHTLFGLKQTPGLSDCLGGSVPFSNICVPTAYAGLFFVPSGTTLNHNLSFFADQIGLILEEGARCFDYVVWDGASVLQNSQASALAELFDGMILVVECEKTKWEVVQMAREKIANSGGEIVGVAMNKRRFYIPRLIYKILSKR